MSDGSRRVVGVDVGGTFTDIVLWDGSALSTGKVSTTDDQSDGVVAGAMAMGDVDDLIHGTTVATNALLERRGARTMLITDAGFEDVIEIGRQDRPSLYDPTQTRPVPLVPRELRIGVPRTGDLNPEEIRRAIRAHEPGAVAVSLLNSFSDGSRERTVAAVIADTSPQTPVSMSHDTVAEFREYERTVTTVVNAFLSPETMTYLDNLAARTAQLGISGEIAVMRSSGGLIPIGDAGRHPASILLSGPAGGVMAAAALGDAMGLGTVVSFDMGGTSTDVCRIEDGRPEVHYERTVAGYPCRMPAVAVHTVGAGGGSLAWTDAGGSLRVGPASAGANPGPACYDRGGSGLTVTDANLVLGRLSGATPLAGGLTLNIGAARRAAEALGSELGMRPTDVCSGVLEVVEEHMANAVRKVSVEEGSDPRDATLVAFGGAGGLHAGALGRRLEMRRAVVPSNAGVFSALGLMVSPPRVDVVATVLLSGDRVSDVAGISADVAARARDRLATTTKTSATSVAVHVDVRYLGQSHETRVPFDIRESVNVLMERFHELHRLRNGFARPGDPLEVVAVRAEATGSPAVEWRDLPVVAPDGEPRRPARVVTVGSREMSAAVWWRPALRSGDEIGGPAVVEEPEATTYIGPEETAVVDVSGALVITW